MTTAVEHHAKAGARWTVSDITCTGLATSLAASAAEVLIETLGTHIQ